MIKLKRKIIKDIIKKIIREITIKVKNENNNRK